MQPRARTHSFKQWRPQAALERRSALATKLTAGYTGYRHSRFPRRPARVERVFFLRSALIEQFSLDLTCHRFSCFSCFRQPRPGQRQRQCPTGVRRSNLYIGLRNGRRLARAKCGQARLSVGRAAPSSAVAATRARRSRHAPARALFLCLYSLIHKPPNDKRTRLSVRGKERAGVLTQGERGGPPGPPWPRDSRAFGIWVYCVMCPSEHTNPLAVESAWDLMEVAYRRPPLADRESSP